MMHTLLRNALLGLVATLGAVGCTAARQVQTPRYVLNVPDYWDVKEVGPKDGQATKIVISNFGTAIDSGVGATAPEGLNYDSRTADVDTRVFAWTDTGSPVNPSLEVAQKLAADPDLQLAQAFAVLETPPECGRFKKKFRLGQAQVEPLDLVKRPGWRTIVAGARDKGTLVGVVMRVEFESADMARNCHNLANMQVKMQDLLDGLTLLAGPSPGAKPPAAAPSPAPPAAPPSPAPPAAPPSDPVPSSPTPPEEGPKR